MMYARRHYARGITVFINLIDVGPNQDVTGDQLTTVQSVA